jgi:ferredoxin-NADP reductase
MEIPGASSASAAMNEPVGRVRWQAATITAVAALTPRIKAFRLRPVTWFAFRAGQHVDIRLTAPDGYQAERSYSVTSAPEQSGIYELAIERLADGEVSPYFHDVAQAGDTVEIRGPVGGHFVWSAGEVEPVLLIGGGSGLAPLVSMARHRALAGSAAPMLVLAGARTWADLPFRDDLLSLEKESGLAFSAALSRDAGRRAADFGRRIDRDIVSLVLERWGHQPALTFVCGSNAFVEAVTAPLIDLGVTASTIRTERFGGTATA